MYVIQFIRGFCMALADSVPGVSGGTIAFLLGFYDQFIDSIDDLISGTKAERNAALMESGGKHQRFWQDIPEQITMVYGVDAHCPEDIGRRIQLLKTAANE